MHFASDNWAGAHPKISAGLERHASGFAPAYGTSDLDKSVERTFAEIFEHDCTVFFLPTGTAANALALGAAGRVGGIGFAHPDAHIREDECGAPEFLSGGQRIRQVPGTNGKYTADALREAIAPFAPGNVVVGRATMASITQVTEIGTVYRPEEIAAIGGVCRESGLQFHMDGARFANALVSLGCTPAEMTWKQGVDMVSFGGTKNGCWCAEALVFFDPSKAEDLPWLRKRSGHLFSKSRFVAAQFEAYLADDLWLDLAAHSNAMAAQLAEAIETSRSVRLAFKPQANEVFAILSRDLLAKFREAGGQAAEWPQAQGTPVELAADETIIRMVASFATGEEDVARFAEVIS